MLALKTNDTWERWIGQLVNDTQYGQNIETAWTDEELAAVGLFRVADPGIPEGKVATASGLQDENSVPTLHYTLEDAPPVPLPVLQPFPTTGKVVVRQRYLASQWGLRQSR